MRTRKTKKSRRKIGRNRRLGGRRRGHGRHGGVGRAGHGKRAAQNKSSYTQEPKEKGFKSKNFQGLLSVNLMWIQKNFAKLQKNGIIDVTEHGFDKVLGKGTLNAPMKIKAREFSKKALDKIKQAGGEAIQC